MVGLVGGFSSALLFLAFAYTQASDCCCTRGDRGRHAGGPRNSAADAHPQGALPVSRRRVARADVRLSGRAGRVAAVPAAAGAEARLVRSALFFGIINAGVALWTTFLFREQIGGRDVCRRPASLAIALLSAALVGGRTDQRVADDNIYADEVIFSRDTPLPAHRADQVERRSAPVPQLASAVQLARRVPLSRGAGASRAGGAAGAAAGAGARRRRRPGGARDPEVSARSSASRWWISIRR